jgi:hypothetical protein
LNEARFTNDSTIRMASWDRPLTSMDSVIPRSFRVALEFIHQHTVPIRHVKGL